MFFEKRFVQPPYRIIVVHMVAEVLVADVLERAVAGTADPVQKTPQPSVVRIVAKNGVVTAFVYQVGRDHHAMGK